MSRFIQYVLAASLLFVFSSVAYAQSYRVNRGDILTIEVLEDNTLNRSVAVLPDGQINFPFAGAIRAAGRSVSQIQSDIRAGIATQFASDPTVVVTVEPNEEVTRLTITPEPKVIEVFFVGEVNAPGMKEANPGATFLQAVSLAEGFTPFAATKRIQVRRTNPRTGAHSVITVNYHAISEGAQLEQDIVLVDGDVILVPERRLFE